MGWRQVWTVRKDQQEKLGLPSMPRQKGSVGALSNCGLILSLPNTGLHSNSALSEKPSLTALCETAPSPPFWSTAQSSIHFNVSPQYFGLLCTIHILFIYQLLYICANSFLKFCLSCSTIFVAPHTWTGILYVLGNFSIEKSVDIPSCLSCHIHVQSWSFRCPVVCRT